MPHNPISSAQNERVKQFLKLQAKPRERKQSGLFPIEGAKEILFALRCGYEIREVFYHASYSEEVASIEKLAPRAQFYTVDGQALEKLAYREGTSWVVATAVYREYSLEELPLSACPLLVVVEGVEKPGNLGAILRSADAAKADAVIVCGPALDLYNPNVVRSSVGCVFSIPVAQATSAEAISFLKNKGIKLFVTHLEASEPYFLQDFTQPCAIVAGSEAWGVTEAWANASDKNIIIPMQGINDSLNLSVAMAIVLFEGVRQRMINA